MQLIWSIVQSLNSIVQLVRCIVRSVAASNLSGVVQLNFASGLLLCQQRLEVTNLSVKSSIEYC